MFRKMTVALAAAAALAALALAPTSASAFGGKGSGGGFGRGLRGIGGDIISTDVIVTDGCIRQRLVDTPFGLVLRPVNVCTFF